MITIFNKDDFGQAGRYTRKMKTLIKKLKGKVSYLVMIIVLLLQLPNLIRNFKSEGQEITPAIYPRIGQGEVLFPPRGSNAIVIFWATWCGPCKIEMNRLKDSVNSGKIPADKVFAINSFEEKTVIEKFLKDYQYPFVFLDASTIADFVQVSKTPTTLFIKNGKITRMSTGVSLFGIWLAEGLFR